MVVGHDGGRLSRTTASRARGREYSPDYYGAFVRDPDGNSLEAVHVSGQPRGENRVGHLWIRVRDLAESRLFYETVAPVVGLRVADGNASRFYVKGETRLFALVQDEPVTENVHLAFPAPDRATVEAFHRAAVEAGFRDNGAPGERSRYHPGYYGAFVLDPDGNNIEAVFHDRPDRGLTSAAPSARHRSHPRPRLSARTAR